MAEPTPQQRADRARTYLERLGIRTGRRRPMVDVQIGEARVEPAAPVDLPPEVPREWLRSDSHGDYGTQPPLPSPEDFAQGFVDAQAAEAAENERQRVRRSRSAAEGNIRAAVPEALEPLADTDVGRTAIAGLAGTPLARAFDPDTSAAVESSTSQQITGGYGDEIAGFIRAGGRPERYLEERDRERARIDEAQRGDPEMYAAAGAFAGLGPALLIPGSGAGSFTRRALQAGVTGLGLGALSGSGHSRNDIDSPEFRADVAREGLIGLGTGVGSEALLTAGREIGNAFRAAPEGTPAPGMDFTPEQQARIRAARDTDPELWRMAREREAAEDAAATRRVRSTADSAALSDVRRAADYSGPGGEGYRGLARDLDETGIMPRRSLGSARDAQLRAARLEEEAGEGIGRFREEMRARTMPDDLDTPIITNPDYEEQLLAEARRARRAEMGGDGTAGARGGRARPRGQSLRNRAESFEDLNTPTPAAEVMSPSQREAFARQTRLDVVRAADPARVRYAQGAQRLRAEADQMLSRAVTPAQEAEAQNLRALADRLEQRGADTFDEAQAVLGNLDREASYGRVYPNAPDAGPRVEQARAGRRVVRSSMDQSVEDTLGPDALAEYQRQRGRYGTARAVGVLGQRGAEREAANLQAGLGDTLQIANAMGQQAPLTARLSNAIEGVIVNRYMRGRAHAGVATLNEMRSDSLAADIVRRLSQTPEGAASARALAAAQARGPRAFGLVLMRLTERDPAVQQTMAQIVEPEADYQGLGLPTADEPLDVGAEGDTDWEALGLPTADDYEEEQRNGNQR